MAATVSSPWSKPGAWALEAEEHESELQKQQPQNDVADFPSLSAATKQPKKKKAQTLSLGEFTAKTTHQSSRLTHHEILSLPTGPRQRSPEELDRNRIGGGFKSYGSNNRHGDDSSNSRYSRESNRELPPSRADEVDDWSKAKKTSSGLGFERRERERGSFFESHSRADESESWVSNKSVETRRFNGGGGFEKRGSFDSLSRGREGERNNGFGGADSESWTKREKDTNEMAAAGGARPKLVLQPRSLTVNADGNAVKPKGSNPFGDARPREEVLAEKGMDHKEIDEKLEAMKINGNGNGNGKEGEKGGKGVDSGSRWSFGSFGNDRGGERSWRKPDVAESAQSANGTENGDDADENVVATDNGNTEEN